MRHPPILCLLGPTCTGKTEVALRLAERFPFEIVSVDSAMVYRGMDIGTGKPNILTRSQTPHHLIDICDPEDPYSAGRFCSDAKLAIEDILGRGHLPLLVGGSMLYFRALLQGISELPAANIAIREALQKEALEKGLAFLHERLRTLDPIAARRIHPNDRQRLLRALGVYEQTGRSLTEFLTQGSQRANFPYEVLQMALVPAHRARLYDRIRFRFEEMLKRGLVSEVKRLRDNPHLTLEAPSIKSVGYRQVWMYLEGQLTETQMREGALTATRHLAKRQITWLNHWPGLSRFESDDPGLFNNLLPLVTAGVTPLPNLSSLKNKISF